MKIQESLRPSQRWEGGLSTQSAMVSSWLHFLHNRVLRSLVSCNCVCMSVQTCTVSSAHNEILVTSRFNIKTCYRIKFYSKICSHEDKWWQISQSRHISTQSGSPQPHVAPLKVQPTTDKIFGKHCTKHVYRFLLPLYSKQCSIISTYIVLVMSNLEMFLRDWALVDSDIHRNHRQSVLDSVGWPGRILKYTQQTSISYSFSICKIVRWELMLRIGNSQSAIIWLFPTSITICYKSLIIDKQYNSWSKIMVERHIVLGVKAVVSLSRKYILFRFIEVIFLVLLSHYNCLVLSCPAYLEIESWSI